MRIRRITPLVVSALLALLVISTGGCAQSETPPSPAPSGEPGAETPPPASGLRLAPGLYELEDGKAQALGTLEWRDVEGGFWVIVDRTGAEGGDGAAVAVIANGAEFQDELKPLEGRQVIVTGDRLEGASVRMAGPEIEVDSIEEVSDTPGIAE